MAKEIAVSVRDKIAQTDSDVIYVCGNSDFVVVFDLDEEWAQYDTKTARFIYNGTHQDKVFSGSVCPVPKLFDINSFKVGLYAGDLCTSTTAYVPAKKGALCGSGLPDDPPPDVYAQIMEQMNQHNYGPENSGKLLYIGSDGSVVPLTLGNGLAIRDGILMITNAQTVRAVCGMVLAGQAKCGEV